MTRTRLEFPWAQRPEGVVRHLFLDLEDTVITPVPDGWGTACPINIEKVKAFIDWFQPDGVHLFSFAVHNDRELEGFRNHVQPWLERMLGREFFLTPTVDGDILPDCCRVKGIEPSSISFIDMSDFWSKHEAFRLFMRHKFGKSSAPGVEVVLLDDAVINESFHWPNLRISGQILNIDEMDESGFIFI